MLTTHHQLPSHRSLRGVHLFPTETLQLCVSSRAADLDLRVCAVQFCADGRGEEDEDSSKNDSANNAWGSEEPHDTHNGSGQRHGTARHVQVMRQLGK